MLKVDNSGQGNCMYYAYSISLMYYLRSKNNPIMTEDIFNKLGLIEEDRSFLRALLAKNKDRSFTREEIKTVIEPILGRATRNLAAAHTKMEFTANPKDTPLFSSLNYAVEYGFKQALKLFESDLADLIENDFSNRDFLEAEICRVDSLFAALQEYILNRTPDVIEEFARQWAAKSEEQSTKEMQAIRATILGDILRNETIAFLLANDQKYLKAYTDHLRGEYVWGCEESLMVLHRAIQGERILRDHGGTVSVAYDHEITLLVHKNSASPSYPADSPEMILNNVGNVHWTSIIPDSIFTPALTEKEEGLMDIIERMQAECGSTSLGLEKYSLINDWLIDLKAQIERIKTSPLSAKQKEIDVFFNLIAQVSVKFSSEHPLKRALNALFSNFLECLPTLMMENTLSSGLAKFGFYSSERSDGMAHDLFFSKSSTTAAQKEVIPLLRDNRHADTIVPAPYPQELNPFVRKIKQSGPRVAEALAQMHQKGLEGDERYTPEKCKDIAEKFLRYAESNNRHFILDGVILFVQQMDRLIKQKERDSERSCTLKAM